MWNLRQEQRGVALGMAAALVVTVISIAAAMIMDQGAPAEQFADRAQFTLRADLFVVAWLAAGVANVARLRFFSERDIAGSGSGGTASAEVQRASAILQNTLEQMVLAVGTHLAVAAMLARSAWLISALVALFCLGRFLFWFGYRRGARGRAFGFGLRFYPSVAALTLSAGNEWLAH